MNSPHQSISYGAQSSPTSLAGMLAPISCQLSSIEHGWELRLVGLELQEVLSILATTCDSNRPSTLLIQNTPGSSSLQVRGIHSDRELLSLGETTAVTWAIRAEGPLEATDIKTLTEVCVEGASPLASELPVVSSVEVLPSGAVSIQTRSREQLLLVAAHVLRSHVKIGINPRQVNVTHPEIDFMHHLLGRSGNFTVRPIETEIYSTWVDIGVSTCPERSMKPADQSVIFDFISSTWHGDF